MFKSAEESDSESLRPTVFDLARIDEMSNGETINGELGNWKLMAYSTEYVLLLHNNKKYGSFQEFDTKRDVIEFLNTC